MNAQPFTSVAKKKQRAKHCFVPGCSTGYRSAEGKHTLFAVPKDPVLFSQWGKNIPRADISLQSHSAVCELHFDERNIERYYPEVRVEGDVVRMKRSVPLLAPDAVPTVFPNLPKYLTKKTPQKRKDRSGGESQLAKCARRSNPIHAKSASVPDFSSAPAEPVSNLRKDCCDGVIVPSSKWIKHPFPECTVFADVHLGPTKSALLADKLMLVTEASPATGEEKLVCTLLLKGSTHKEVQLTTATELQQFLDDTDRSELCIGAGVSEEFLPLQVGDTATVRIREGAAISRKCTRTVDTQGN